MRIPKVPGMEVAVVRRPVADSASAATSARTTGRVRLRRPERRRRCRCARTRATWSTFRAATASARTIFFRNRVQLAGSGGEFTTRQVAADPAPTPLGLATLLPNSQDAPNDAILVINSHYFNTASKRRRGFVRITLRLRPYDGKRRVVRNLTPDRRELRHRRAPRRGARVDRYLAGRRRRRSQRRRGRLPARPATSASF